MVSFAFAPDNSLVSVGSGCFAETAIEEMALPPTVTELGSYVFLNAASFRQLTFSPVTHIGAFLCLGTQLSALTVPETVTTIEARAFMGLGSLTAVDFSKSVNLTRIGSKAFAGAGIAQAILSQRIDVIEAGAFSDCPRLRVFKVPPEAPFASLLPETLAWSGVVSVVVPRIRTIAANSFTDCGSLRQLVMDGGDQTKTDRFIRIPDDLLIGTPAVFVVIPTATLKRARDLFRKEATADFA